MIILPKEIDIIEFHPLEASKQLINSYLDFSDRMYIEFFPEEDPRLSRNKREKEIITQYPLLDYYRWLVLSKTQNNNDVIGYARIYFPNEKNPIYPTNKHIGWFTIDVDKKYRRQGIGTGLLRRIIEKTSDIEEAQILQSHSFCKAGWKFNSKYGGKLVLEGAMNRLKLDEVDWDLLNSWKINGDTFAKENKIQLLFFDRVPDDILEDYAGIYTKLTKLVPVGELDEDYIETAESRRIREKEFQDIGVINLTVISIEENGIISGLTEVNYSLDRAQVVDQELTGVLPEFQGRGLGKWLKASMLFYIRENFPRAKFIDTGNADSNAPMLSINDRMGFKQHLVEKCYKFELSDLREKFNL